MPFGLFDDKGQKLFGKDDPQISALKKSAEQGQQRGTSQNVIGGAFPVPLVSALNLEGSLGDWSETTPAHFLPYPGIELKTGFTDPQKVGEEYEYVSYDENSNPTTPNDNLDSRIQTYDFFNDYSAKQFTHLLDYFMEQNGSLGDRRKINVGESENGVTIPANTKDIYLGSYIRTWDDNEDPTMHGYDIYIRWNESPLFNGTIDSFITGFGNIGNSEIASRLDVLNKFKQQLVRFIKNDSPSASGRPDFLNQNGVKTYYMRNLSGLNSLVESNDSNKIKSFVDYGNEFITLEFNEDVSQNIGYLASLYKSLSWSRINGKQIIPENLLRFDVDIEITEVRKYNKVISNKGKDAKVYSDLISKYTYTLYECQFFFQNLPHGDSIDMSNIKAIDKYDIKFNFKYSTMKFGRLSFEEVLGNYGKMEYVNDNRYINTNTITSGSTNNSTIQNNTITNATPYYPLPYYNAYSSTGEPDPTPTPRTGPLQVVKESESRKSKLKKAAQTLKKDLTNAVINEANRQIIAQASLLNKTLDNIRNAIPGAGRMSAPTNVYSEYNIPLANDAINAARNFVGSSIKSFFSDPGE